MRDAEHALVETRASQSQPSAQRAKSQQKVFGSGGALTVVVFYRETQGRLAVGVSASVAVRVPTAEVQFNLI